ncbi:MAG TPA: tRNA (adenosine(37)-N6)-dimethylallyltransferase MiaA [Terriglobia bacterium]|nr:tRNA (adenosine(37)-N6)-dimethylallyltransferase MiaA [Terriglobia bacterium]
MHPIIAVVGPTASGKSDLAVSLAERFNGEIVNYDSVQVFRGLDIGSAKPSHEERQRIPHHMIDIREPEDLFTAGDYQREARAVLEDLGRRGRLPVLVGGTGLYLRALTEGLFQGPARSAYWRTRLEGLAESRGREYLHRLLRRLDPEAASRIAERDKPKIIRALEVRLETGKPLTEHLKQEARRPLKGFVVFTVGLDPPRDECYRRIDARVERMFEAGLVEEVRGLLARGIPSGAKALGAIGYRHVVANLNNNCAWDDTIRMIQRDTRRYAKRQLTWFRRQSETTWFGGPGDNKAIEEEVHRKVNLFLGEFYGV